ncbi:SIR2 family protein [Salinibacter grassmerensis]|uniref:SIR2 family protein n=1 Tax=Salinibacter grassmerensis TaxID=3040353 RepID=UPI0021E96479|nr:SIR2 family protein [Salinibacter grassmerensis]
MNDVSLPPPLNQDFADHGGHSITLILGAGCSFDGRTDLPLSKAVSQRVYQELVDDGYLEEDFCDDPSDLSEVAEAVSQVTGGLEPIVGHIRQRFLHVDANEGHQIAAAMMREGIISCVITLNYDDAMSQALGDVSGQEVSEIRSVSTQSDFGDINLVYLHGKADADNPNDLVMRTGQLNNWQETWGEAIVQSQLIRSSTVFAGLGTPVKVLTETAKKLHNTFSSASTFYQVDPSPYEQENEDGELEKAPLADAIGIQEGQYVSCGWNAFMRKAGKRALIRQVRDLCNECADMAWNDERALFDAMDPEEQTDLEERIKSYLHSGSTSFLDLGRLRAHWFLMSEKYTPHNQNLVARWVGRLLLAVDFVARRYDFDQVVFRPSDGSVEFSRSGNPRSVVARLFHGRGDRGWSHVDSKLTSTSTSAIESVNQATCVLGRGLDGDPQNIAPPSDLTNPDASKDRQSISDSTPYPTRVDTHNLQEKTDELDSVFEIDS